MPQNFTADSGDGATLRLSIGSTGSIGNDLEQLKNETSLLYDLVAILKKRLEPMCRLESLKVTGNDSEKTDSLRPNRSHLSSEIESQTSVVFNARRILEDISDRLEI